MAWARERSRDVSGMSAEPVSICVRLSPVVSSISIRASADASPCSMPPWKRICFICRRMSVEYMYNGWVYVGMIAVKSAGFIVDGVMLGVVDKSVVVETIDYMTMTAGGSAVAVDGESVFGPVAIGTGEVVGKGLAHVVGTYDDSPQSEAERTEVVG